MATAALGQTLPGHPYRCGRKFPGITVARVLLFSRGGGPIMNASAMIDTCFRHQHPEAYGEIEVSEPLVPVRLRYGHDRAPASLECLAEESLGYPDSRALT
jgi:hypothetical protein